MGSFVPAVDSAVRILRFMASKGAPVGVTHLARELGLNKSTCHNILRTLLHHEMISYDEESRMYDVGAGLVELGGALANNLDVVQVARPYAETLVRKTGFTCLIGKLMSETQISVVARVDSPRAVAVTVPVGRRLTLTAPAFGRVFLAWMPVERVERLITQSPLPAFTEHSQTDSSEFMAELERVRQRGYSTSRREFSLNNNAVAAPLFTAASAQVRHAICLLGFASEMKDEYLDYYGNLTMAAAVEMSRQLGGKIPNHLIDSAAEMLPELVREDGG